jgi:predicted anti-sigma-YlaC factor YlaD
MRGVDCLTCREALSARLDGEAEPVPAEDTDQHLASCAECQSWQTRVTRTSRELRVRQATPVPDLSAAILENAVPPQNIRGWWARIALVVVAAAQVGLVLSQMLGVGVGHGGVPASGHVLNESLSWNLAIGVGLLWAAFRTRVTSGLIPVLGGFVLLVAAYSGHDLATGAVAGSRVVQHGLLVLALGLLIVINRRYNDPSPGHGDALGSGTEGVVPATDPAEPSSPEDVSDRRGPLRPAGRAA